MKLPHLALALPALALAAPAFALNIVLSNDDGLTSNTVALYKALKAKGHDVIVSVPCANQSGMGAAVKYLSPLTPLTAACVNGAASIGDPGAGAMTKSGYTTGDYYYVNGTPVMATMYGLDVAGYKRWGKAPDLVLSGPNEGQNVGSIVNGSGTVSNAQFAAARGIPSIALSADGSTVDSSLAGAASVTVANLSVTLIETLQAKAGTGPLLPDGVALNVNFPKDLSNPVWAFSRFGSYNTYTMKFVEDIGADPIGAAYGLGNYHYPAVSISNNTTAATSAQADDESNVYKTKISVTAMQVGFEHRPQGQAWLRVRLRDLLK